MKIIALCGARHTGKTTIATHLETYYDYKRLSFAQPIREMLSAILDINPDIDKDQPLPNCGDRSLRQMLQSLGCWGRRIDENFWCRQLITKAIVGGYEKIVIDDLRFDNEKLHLRKYGADIVRIRNMEAEVNQPDSHPTEQDWPYWIPDLEFHNNTEPETAKKIATQLADLLAVSC